MSFLLSRCILLAGGPFLVPFRVLRHARLHSALSAFEPVDYVFPIESEITTHLHVRQGVGIADFCAFTCLLVNPGRLYLQAFGDLRGGEYFFHVVGIAPFCAN
jgi:hypothetical protein